MARYYFHAHDHSGFVRDQEGQDLPGPDAARDMALRSAREIMGEDVRQGCLDLRGRIDVTDGEGRMVLTLSFLDALSIMTGNPPQPGLVVGDGTRPATPP